nr:MAG TPA: hypothetical protein [Caudoviricetes sp.]
MEITKILNPNIETLELILDQVKEIEQLGLKVKSISLEDIEDPELKVKSISLEDIEDPELEWGGSKWIWEIESTKEINSFEEKTLMIILDTDNAGDFTFEHSEKNYKFILEVY